MRLEVLGVGAPGPLGPAREGRGGPEEREDVRIPGRSILEEEPLAGTDAEGALALLQVIPSVDPGVAARQAAVRAGNAAEAPVVLPECIHVLDTLPVQHGHCPEKGGSM